MFDTVDTFKAKIQKSKAAYRVSKTRFPGVCFTWRGGLSDLGSRITSNLQIDWRCRSCIQEHTKGDLKIPTRSGNLKGNYFEPARISLSS